MKRSVKVLSAMFLSVVAIPALAIPLAPLSLITSWDQFPSDDFALSGRFVEGTLTHKDGTVVSWDVSVGRSITQRKLIADVVVASGKEEATANVAVDDKELVVTNLVGSLDARVIGSLAPAGSPFCDGIVEASVPSFTFSQTVMSGVGSLTSEKLDCRVGGFIPLVLDKVSASLEERSTDHNGRVEVKTGDTLLVETVHADVGLLTSTLYTSIKQVFPLFLSDTDLVLATRYQVFRK